MSTRTPQHGGLPSEEVQQGIYATPRMLELRETVIQRGNHLGLDVFDALAKLEGITAPQLESFLATSALRNWSGRANTSLLLKKVAENAAERGEPPVEAAIDIATRALVRAERIERRFETQNRASIESRLGSSDPRQSLSAAESALDAGLGPEYRNRIVAAIQNSRGGPTGVRLRAAKVATHEIFENQFQRWISKLISVGFGHLSEGVRLSAAELAIQAGQQEMYFQQVHAAISEGLESDQFGVRLSAAHVAAKLDDAERYSDKISEVTRVALNADDFYLRFSGILLAHRRSGLFRKNEARIVSALGLGLEIQDIGVFLTAGRTIQKVGLGITSTVFTNILRQISRDPTAKETLLTSSGIPVKRRSETGLAPRGIQL